MSQGVSFRKLAVEVRRRVKRARKEQRRKAKRTAEAADTRTPGEQGRSLGTPDSLKAFLGR
jgi:hypothetical protein